MFYQEALPIFCFVSESIPCLQSQIDTDDQLPLHSKKPNQQIHFRLHGTGAFMWGAYFCMGAYKRNVVAEIKMGAYIHGGAYFVWVLIIPILRYLQRFL